jgi:hypothetical protein
MMQPCRCFRRFSENRFGVRQKGYGSPKVKCALLAIEEVHFKFFAQVRAHFSKQIFFCRERSHCFIVIHRRPQESSVDFLSVRRSDSSRAGFKTAIIAEESLLDSLRGSECDFNARDCFYFATVMRKS